MVCLKVIEFTSEQNQSISESLLTVGTKFDQVSHLACLK